MSRAVVSVAAAPESREREVASLAFATEPEIVAQRVARDRRCGE